MTHTPPSWSADLRGTTPDPRDRLLWTLAWYTYGAHLPYGTTPWDPATQPDLPTGWHRIDDDELASAGYSTATFRNHESGLRGEVFARGPGPMVLAFCGTNDRRDWVSNADQALGRSAAQYTQAIDLVVQGHRSVGEDLVFTGHSLGGGLAAAAALATGLTAVTFDAAGLHERTIAQAADARHVTTRNALADADDGQIRAYHTTTDLLTTLQANPEVPMPAALGTQIALPVPASPARRGWRAAGLGLGAGLGAALGGLATGLSPAGARAGAAAGALVGQGVGAGIHGHLYRAIDGGLAALFEASAHSGETGE